MKSVTKESKLMLIIMTMIYEKIHRILIEDTESKIYISVLNFKDIFLDLLKIANESHLTYYNSIDINSLLDIVKPINI